MDVSFLNEMLLGQGRAVLRPLLHGSYFDDALIVLIVLLFAGIFWYILSKDRGDETSNPPDQPDSEE